MGLEEVGTEGVKKTKEKLKKDKKNMGTLKEDKESKKKRVENGSGTEDCNGHFGDENECGKGSEICLPKNQDGNVIEKVGVKKKRSKNSGINDSAVGQGLDINDVMSGHKKTISTRKKSVGSPGFGIENMEVTLLAEPEVTEKSNQQGVSVEPFSEGNTFESAEKEERRKKRKRKKDMSIGHQQGERVEAFGGGHVLETADKEEKRKKKREMDSGKVSEGDMQGNDLTAQSDLVTKDEKKRKKKNKNEKGGSGSSAGTTMELETADKDEKRKKKREMDSSKVSEGDMQGNDLTAQSAVVTKDEKKRKKKNKKDKGGSGSSAGTTMDLESDLNDGIKGKKGKVKSDDIESEDPKPKKTKKKVSFSGKDEVFQSPEDNLVHGKRFSKEEDEIVKEAVFNYIETNDLGEEGLNMVLNCSSYPKIRNCWQEIGTALPHRPRSAIYYRAHILFRRGEKRKWTKEEIEILRASQKKHGNQWKAVADELGKHRVHVKDTWRRIRHENMKKGRWSQDEYQTLFDLVNLDLRMKYAEEKKSKHGMLRDNVPWTAISDKMTTRAEPNICLKWYSQLTSPMVMNGDWADSDDYRLIDALFELDAICHEDVDWDSLIEHRSGTVCQKRWSEMVLHIGDNLKRSFADQVEVLAKRYCPELLEAKENWESKPVVP